jgi:glycerol-3-phosphate acyltransferase PlsY
VPILSYAIVVVAAYLLGSIPTGFLVGKAKGVDIRTMGSKNMGATNVFRVLGIWPGIFVLIVDALKGFVAVTAVINFYGDLHGYFPRVFGVNGYPDNQHQEYLGIVAGIAAVLGHNYTCWLKFKGGKGIATSGGVYIALSPLAVCVAVVAWIVVLLVTRYVSVASIAAAIALPATVWFTSDNLLLQIVTTGLGVLAIAKHQGNIQRLLNGTERRFGGKPEIEEAAK